MPIVRLDKIAAQHLASVRSETDILLNGYFVQLGGLIEGEQELYTATAPTDISNEVLLHATPEVDPDPRRAGLTNFQVEIGEEGRVYHLAVGDVITLTADLFDGAVAVDDVVVPQVGSYRLAVGDATTSRLSAVVIQETMIGYDNEPAFAIRVLSV
jgi:hypothetical protein